MKENIKELFRYLDASPTAFHAVENVKAELLKKGFVELAETEAWKLVAGKKYFVVRNHSALLAFCLPKKEPEGFHIAAAHTDSPAFKIKENPEIKSELYVKLNVEKYGGMIVSTWFDRPLSVAGRIFTEEEDGIRERLVNVDRDFFVIPSLAIHMDRKTNEGHSYQIQKELLPLFSEKGTDTFRSFLARETGIAEESILEEELYLYTRQKGSLIGANEEWILSPRLDDLQCVFAAMEGIKAAKPQKEISVAALFDNEEVGSGTKQGADSDFLSEVMERIGNGLGFDAEKKICMKNSSFLLSADNAHAVHPNYPEKADPNHQPRLNGGIVIKYHGGQKYTTDAFSAARLKRWCKEWQIPYQTYHNHSDIPGGSTLGNISATHVSVPSVDIGFAELAMHSAVETAGREDIRYGIRLFQNFFSM
ncbi:MAG: M18 family aminopeptidase [Lachnospiraceae bacterium]|nr:M18 family aminopeptidase [Lachnospiraceae bacterium]